MDVLEKAEKAGDVDQKEFRVSEPLKSEHVIHVDVDKNLEYHGLPEYWRKVLGVEKTKSHEEFKAEPEHHQKIVPQKASKKILFFIKQITENTIIVSSPLKTEHEIHVEVDPNSATGFRGLPPELEQILLESNFSKTEVMENPSEVLDAVSYADLWEDMNDNHLKLRFPTNEEVKHLLVDKFQLKKNDPVDEYQVVKRIGSGGYGSIFLCRAKQDKTKTYAMKIVKPVNQDEITYIISEIAMMQVMKHENIVPLLDAYYFKSHYFMILEFMDFGDLTKLIDRKWGSFPQDVIAYIMRETLQGLKELHDQHRIHRDLKSDNILISYSGEVKLADFGYIAQLTEEKKTRTTQVGTACWMAPEVIRKEDYDQRSDIWSLGITLYEITNKDPPYLGQKKARAFYAILINDPPSPQPREKWSEELHGFCNACLHKDPAERLDAHQLLKHPFLKKIKPATKETFKRFLVCE